MNKHTFDRHAFNALYGFRCDCADCASPHEKERQKALARSLKPAPRTSGEDNGS